MDRLRQRLLRRSPVERGLPPQRGGRVRYHRQHLHFRRVCAIEVAYHASVALWEPGAAPTIASWAAVSAAAAALAFSSIGPVSA